jgi:hypothetical protein
MKILIRFDKARKAVAILGLSLAHGLQTPNEAFFLLKSRTFGLGQTNWADEF